MTPQSAHDAPLKSLRAVLDTPAARYRQLNGAKDFGRYLSGQLSHEDEELLTEPILRDLLERLLGFPPDGYFEQLSRSGLKPDFTPIDLVAHRFVLDAKSSRQELAGHEPQIRSYIDQRQLDHGILFNLREIRVYRRGVKGHDPKLSFPLRPLWDLARGEAMPDERTLESFRAFCVQFAFREMSPEAKIEVCWA